MADVDAAQGIYGLAGIIVTGLLAYATNVRRARDEARAEREAEKRKAQQDREAVRQEERANLGDTVDQRVSALLTRYDREADRREARITALERRVEELQAELTSYSLGLAAPVGYVVVPLPLFETVRDTLKGLHPGPLVGDPHDRLPDARPNGA